MSYALAIDIGNTNTVFGLLKWSQPGDDKTLPPVDRVVIKSWRTVTRRDRTSDELGIFLSGFFHNSGIRLDEVQICVYSSVVPPLNPIVERMIHDYFHVPFLKVTYDLSLPIVYDYPRPYELGADRIVNAVAVYTIFKRDAIIIDLGTATTFCIMHGNAYQGGVIAPGVKMAMDTLTQRTSLLPPVEFMRPQSGVIGDSTVHGIQSGFFYGWVGLLGGIITEIRKAHPERNYLVVAMGGLSRLIHDEVPDLFDVVDSDLSLKGLSLILHQNYESVIQKAPDRF